MHQEMLKFSVCQVFGDLELSTHLGKRKMAKKKMVSDTPC